MPNICFVPVMLCALCIANIWSALGRETSHLSLNIPRKVRHPEMPQNCFHIIKILNQPMT
jgi:hypothetical protein